MLLAVSSDTPEVNAKAQDGFAWRLLSDPSLANAKRFKSYDDFEEMPIHSTLLIDARAASTGDATAEVPSPTTISWPRSFSG